MLSFSSSLCNLHEDKCQNCSMSCEMELLPSCSFAWRNEILSVRRWISFHVRSVLAIYIQEKFQILPVMMTTYDWFQLQCWHLSTVSWRDCHFTHQQQFSWVWVQHGNLKTKTSISNPVTKKLIHSVLLKMPIQWRTVLDILERSLDFCSFLKWGNFK